MWTSASRRAGKHVLGERAGASQLPATQLPALPLLSGTEEVSSKQQQTYPLFQGFCTGPWVATYNNDKTTGLCPKDTEGIKSCRVTAAEHRWLF